MNTDSPPQIGSFYKLSESTFTEGLAEAGAVEGKILKYSDDYEDVLVMALVFANSRAASDSFKELSGDEIDTDLYYLGVNSDEDYYGQLIGNSIYLVSGDIGSATVITLTDAISECIPSSISQ